MTRDPKLLDLIRDFRDAMLDALATHIYGDDDPRPADCPYCALIDRADAILAISKPPAADPYETAARAEGWDHGGDCGGFIFHKPTWGTWKAAASWSGEGTSPVYDTWRECCEGEEIEIGTPFDVALNYQTASGGNTYRARVKALDPDQAIDKARELLRADRRRKVVKIDGGDVSPA